MFHYTPLPKAQALLRFWGLREDYERHVPCLFPSASQMQIPVEPVLRL